MRIPPHRDANNNAALPLDVIPFKIPPSASLEGTSLTTALCRAAPLPLVLPEPSEASEGNSTACPAHTPSPDLHVRAYQLALVCSPPPPQTPSASTSKSVRSQRKAEAAHQPPTIIPRSGVCAASRQGGRWKNPTSLHPKSFNPTSISVWICGYWITYYHLTPISPAPSVAVRSSTRSY